MVYESRRSRRLRLEHQQKTRTRRRVILYVTTVTTTIIFFGATLVASGKINFSPLALLKTPASVEIKQTAPETSVQKINRKLAAKLEDYNKELAIDYQANLLDLPSHTATAVVLRDLSDKNQGSVNYNGDTQFISASTYKIFLAYVMINDVETGRATWSSPLNQTTWEKCLSKMIINSDNSCANAYLGLMGYDHLNQLVSDLGASQQTVFSLGNMRTTANDLALVLEKLYRGQLMSEDNKNRLLSLMQQQVYRDGIPAGVGSDDIVYDKVGFLDGLFHDAGIVHTSKGDYILVVMTNGESWEYIAKISNFVNKLFLR